MVELLGRTAGPVVRVRRHEHAHARAATCRLLDPPDHAAVGDVRIHDVERVLRSVDERRRSQSVIGRNRPGALWSTTAVIGLGPSSSGGNSSGTLARRDLAAEPAQAGDEHELQLRDDRAFDADEQVVELAVLEVILDPGAADPADPAVDDHDLAMVDVPQPAQVPAGRSARAERPSRRPRLGRAGHAHLNPRLRQPLVELPRAALGVGALPIHDQPARERRPVLSRSAPPRTDRPRARDGTRTG